MNKIVKYLLTVVLAGSVVCSSNAVLYATEVNEITNDVVVDGVIELITDHECSSLGIHLLEQSFLDRIGASACYYTLIL